LLNAFLSFFILFFASLIFPLCNSANSTIPIRLHVRKKQNPLAKKLGTCQKTSVQRKPK
jgi:hypothetical protein